MDLNMSMHFKAHKICSDLLGGAWKQISPHEMSLIPVRGGMSNSLYCCSLPGSLMTSNDGPSQVLLRLYGDQLRSGDTSIQLEIFNLLSKKKLGPKLYGSFEEGRIEEYLQASSMTCEELVDRDISKVIARKMAHIHSLDVPINKKNIWILDKFKEWFEYINGALKSRPNIREGLGQPTMVIVNELMSINYVEEERFIRNLIGRIHSPLVFSHNDLHQGNILLAEVSKRRPNLSERVVFIDFEYCSYNYCAYDIANHFCEWCFEYDTSEYPHFRLYEDRFPSENIQRDFLRQYIDQRRLLSSCKNSPPLMENKVNCYGNHRYVNGSNKVHSNGTNKDTEEETLLSEIRSFTMIANFLWMLWSIKSACTSSIKFGYWEHALARWRLYQRSKAEFMQMNRNQNRATNGTVLPTKILSHKLY